MAGVATTDISSDAQSSPVILPYYDHSVRYVLGPADLDQTIIASNPGPVVIQPAREKGYEVELHFNPPDAFDAIAAERYAHYQQNPQQPSPESLEAIEVDGEVFSAPAIEAPSFNGAVVISGSADSPFTLQQAKDLVLAILYAKMPGHRPTSA
jgi:hypothetical protein